MRIRVGILAVAIQLGGCASAELNSNTLDLASTTDDLMMQQVFYNLSNFIDSDRAYPAQAVVSSGTATTSDTLGGSFNYPLTSMVATTAELVRTVGGMNAGNQFTNTRVATAAGGSILRAAPTAYRTGLMRLWPMLFVHDD
jgi:hypothetical protein